MKKSTSAIIITYNPDLLIVKANVESLLESRFIKEIIIIDNGSEKKIDEMDDIPNVTVKYMSSNLGIATAQNVGLKIAQHNGADFALLLDQDSEVNCHLVEKLVHGFNELCNAGYKIAAVGPRPFDLFENKPMELITNGAGEHKNSDLK